MEHEIIVGVQSGNVTFSFKTDREGSNLKEGFDAIHRLISAHKALVERASSAHAASVIREHRTTVSISNLSIPSEDKDAILRDIDGLPRFDLLLMLLQYAKRQLDFDQIMSLSNEIGKPIKYNWLDSELHRPERKGFILSERVPGQPQRLYSLTERGKKRAEAIILRIKRKLENHTVQSKS